MDNSDPAIIFMRLFESQSEVTTDFIMKVNSPFATLTALLAFGYKSNDPKLGLYGVICSEYEFGNEFRVSGSRTLLPLAACSRSFNVPFSGTIEACSTCVSAVSLSITNYQSLTCGTKRARVITVVALFRFRRILCMSLDPSDTTQYNHHDWLNWREVFSDLRVNRKRNLHLQAAPKLKLRPSSIEKFLTKTTSSNCALVDN